MESTIYLVRHGRPALPDYEMRFLGRTDLPLSPEGEELARFRYQQISPDI